MIWLIINLLHAQSPPSVRQSFVGYPNGRWWQEEFYRVHLMLTFAICIRMVWPFVGSCFFPIFNSNWRSRVYLAFIMTSHDEINRVTKDLEAVFCFLRIQLIKTTRRLIIGLISPNTFLANFVNIASAELLKSRLRRKLSCRKLKCKLTSQAQNTF